MQAGVRLERGHDEIRLLPAAGQRLASGERDSQDTPTPYRRARDSDTDHQRVCGRTLPHVVAIVPVDADVVEQARCLGAGQWRASTISQRQPPPIQLHVVIHPLAVVGDGHAHQVLLGILDHLGRRRTSRVLAHRPTPILPGIDGISRDPNTVCQIEIPVPIQVSGDSPFDRSTAEVPHSMANPVHVRRDRTERIAVVLPVDHGAELVATDQVDQAIPVNIRRRQ